MSAVVYRIVSFSIQPVSFLLPGPVNLPREISQRLMVRRGRARASERRRRLRRTSQTNNNNRNDKKNEKRPIYLNMPI